MRAGQSVEVVENKFVVILNTLLFDNCAALIDRGDVRVVGMQIYT